MTTELETKKDVDNFNKWLKKVDEKSESALNDLLSVGDLDLIRTWFNELQDVHPQYLQHQDFHLAEKIYKALEMRVPESVAKECR